MARSLNKVILIGNLTRDPELRYTPQGTAVCTFGLATNRQWVTDSGEKKEDVEFHRLVAWNKLAEICSQLLTKGRKVYAEGRLQTRNWIGQDGMQRTTVEVVLSDMIVLDSRKEGVAPGTESFDIPDSALKEMGEIPAQDVVVGGAQPGPTDDSSPKTKKATKAKKDEKTPETSDEEEIPF